MQYMKGGTERDEEVKLRLYVPKDLRLEISEQCLEKLDHMGIDKNLIGWNYYWLRLYSEVTMFKVARCVRRKVGDREWHH